LAGDYAGRLHFNVSHSGGLALVAITTICPVGVDLEEIRSLRYDLEIAKRFFTTSESAKLESLPVTDRPLAFFSLWTRKEAWLKAKGVGIAESLNHVDIACLPDEPVRVLDVTNEPKEAEQWTLAHLNPAEGFTGALAIRRPTARISCWRFPG
jgi:4'-phosphopantetheinyl transferase